MTKIQENDTHHCWYPGPGLATPKCASIAHYLFWIQANLETASARTLWPSSLSPWNQEINFSYERYIPCIWGRRTLFSPETRNLSPEFSMNKPRYFFNLLPQGHTLYILHQLSIWTLGFFVLSIPHKYIISLSTKYKSWLIWPLL